VHGVVDHDAVHMAMLAALLVALALSTSALFSAGEPVQLEIEAPLSDLLTHDREDNDYAVTGALTVIVDGRPVRINGVRVSVRGHTSRRDTECHFPKLKVDLPADARAATPLLVGLGSIKIGTHCGEVADGQLTQTFGRLANEHSPLREAFVYRLLAALEVPALHARRARITYRDTAGSKDPFVRHALIIEDSDDAVKRVGGARDISEDEFSTARDQLTTADSVRLAFAEALIGNFDWCLRMAPDDTYRCNARHTLWNILAADHGNGRVTPLIYDFDVAGIVTGGHPWFKNVFTRAFDPSLSEADIEVIAQLQRARTLFPRHDLDEARKAFIARKTHAFEALESAELDPEGKTIARRYLEAFYANIEPDDEFYRPVVRTPQTQAYADAEGEPICGDRSVVPVGTPVSGPLQRAGDRVQVIMLDAHWHWAEAASCDAIRRNPVSADFPPRSSRLPERRK
jgi:hypothetical protein